VGKCQWWVGPRACPSDVHTVVVLEYSTDGTVFVLSVDGDPEKGRSLAVDGQDLKLEA
jgi:hypothetical protein